MSKNVWVTRSLARQVGACSACGYGHGPLDGEVYAVGLGSDASTRIRLCEACLDELIAQTRPAEKKRRDRVALPANRWKGLRLNAFGRPDVTPTRGEQATLPKEEEERRISAWMGGHDHCTARFGAGEQARWDDSDWDAALKRYVELGGDPKWQEGDKKDVHS